jgi:hypothetical protein
MHLEVKRGIIFNSPNRLIETNSFISGVFDTNFRFNSNFRPSKRSCISTKNSKKKLFSPESSSENLNKLKNLKNMLKRSRTQFMAKGKIKNIIWKEENDEKSESKFSQDDLQKIIKGDDKVFWKEFERNNEPLDEKEFVRNCNTGMCKD